MSGLLADIFSARIILSLFVIAAAVVVLIFLRRFGRRFDRHGKDADHSDKIGRMIVRTLVFLVIFITFLAVLQMNDINITSLIAGLGLASAIVGLALQDILKDVITGLHLATDRFFAVGDCVEFDGREGIVSGFSVISTKITDLEDQSVTAVCNREITKIRRLDKRLDLDIPLGYELETAKAAAVLQAACKKIAENDGVEECRLKGIQAFGESAVLYRIRILCTPKYRPGVRRRALLLLRETLQQADIRLPFNQLDVHLEQ